MLFSHGKKKVITENVEVIFNKIGDSVPHRKTHVHYITPRELQDNSVGNVLMVLPVIPGIVLKNSLVVLVQCCTHVVASPVVHGIKPEEVGTTYGGCEETCTVVQRNRQRA